MKYHCPKCKGFKLRVEIKATMQVVQEHGEIHAIDDDARVHFDWTEDSPMFCDSVACGFEGHAWRFDTRRWK